MTSQPTASPTASPAAGQWGASAPTGTPNWSPSSRVCSSPYGQQTPSAPPKPFTAPTAAPATPNTPATGASQTRRSQAVRPRGCRRPTSNVSGDHSRAATPRPATLSAARRLPLGPVVVARALAHRMTSANSNPCTWLHEPYRHPELARRCSDVIGAMLRTNSPHQPRPNTSTLAAPASTGPSCVWGIVIAGDGHGLVCLRGRGLAPATGAWPEPE